MKIKLYISIFCLRIFFCESQTSNYLFNFDSAIVYYKTHVNAAILKNDTNAIFKNGRKLITSYLGIPNYEKAEQEIKQLNKYVINNKSINAYYLLSASADLDNYKANNPSAIDKYIRVHNFFEQEKNWKELLKSCIDLAEFYRRTSDYNRAKKYLLEANKIYTQYQLNDTAQLIRLNNRYAAIYNETYNADSSIVYSFKALKIATEAKDQYALGVTYNEIGYSYRILSIDSTLKYYNLAEQAFKSIGAWREVAGVVRNCIMLKIENNPFSPKHKQTSIKSKELIELIKEKKLDIPLGIFYYGLSQDYYYKGDSLNYYKYKAIWLTEENSRMWFDNKVKVNEIQSKYENEKTATEIKISNQKLKLSNSEAEQKKTQRNIVSIFLILSIILVISIGYLLVLRNRLNKELNAKNKLQESLIQEIHHRVKNNLQLTSGLLEMHQNTIGEDNKLLLDASRRISSMALVHEMLYNKEIDQIINLKPYVEALVAYLYNDNNSITYHVTIKDAQLNVSQCTAVGMVISELISNSTKYAFHSIAQPTINISIQQQNNNIVFNYNDNGVGVADWEATKKGLGSRLIDIFSRQLKGKYIVNSQNGFHYSITFSIAT